MAAFTPWEILLARIPNTDGTPPPYAHPCIYLGDSPKFPRRIIVLGITSNLAEAVPDYSVELPWAPGGHKVTGLERPSIAQAHWRDHIVLDAVAKVLGYTPLPEQVRIARTLRLWQSRNSAK